MSGTMSGAVVISLSTEKTLPITLFNSVIFNMLNEFYRKFPQLSSSDQCLELPSSFCYFGNKLPITHNPPPPPVASTEMVDAVRTRLNVFAKNFKRVQPLLQTCPDFYGRSPLFPINTCTQHPLNIRCFITLSASGEITCVWGRHITPERAASV